MKKWHKIALGKVAVAVGAFGALMAVSRYQVHKLVTHPIEKRDPIEKTPGDYGLLYEDVTVTNADGLKLVAWYLPSQNGAAVMAQHGFRVDRTDVLNQAQILHRHGYGVLLTSIRAHDLSEGERISFGRGEMQDLDTWYTHLLTRDDVDPDKIGMLGNSMGGALTIRYAAQNDNIKAVVAHSVFASLDGTISTGIRHYTRLLPFPFTSMVLFWAEREAGFDASEIDPTVWIRDVSPRPVFLMHGGLDDYIPSNSGELLYAAAGEPKELWYAEDVGHCQFDIEKPEEYERRIVGFFDQYLLGR